MLLFVVVVVVVVAVFSTTEAMFGIWGAGVGRGQGLIVLRLLLEFRCTDRFQNANIGCFLKHIHICSAVNPSHHPVEEISAGILRLVVDITYIV